MPTAKSLDGLLYSVCGNASLLDVVQMAFEYGGLDLLLKIRVSKSRRKSKSKSNSLRQGFDITSKKNVLIEQQDIISQLKGSDAGEKSKTSQFMKSQFAPVNQQQLGISFQLRKNSTLLRRDFSTKHLLKSGRFSSSMSQQNRRASLLKSRTQQNLHGQGSPGQQADEQKSNSNPKKSKNKFLNEMIEEEDKATPRNDLDFDDQTSCHLDKDSYTLSKKEALPNPYELGNSLNCTINHDRQKKHSVLIIGKSKELVSVNEGKEVRISGLPGSIEDTNSFDEDSSFSSSLLSGEFDDNKSVFLPQSHRMETEVNGMTIEAFHREGYQLKVVLDKQEHRM